MKGGTWEAVGSEDPASLGAEVEAWVGCKLEFKMECLVLFGLS